MVEKNGESIVIPSAVIKRLPKYHRNLESLLDKGVERISSREFGKIAGVSAPQLRQDLNHFGNFGQQGYGYNVENLYNALSKIMGIEKKSNMVLVGVGNIGQALVNSTDFTKRGFYLSAIFDINPRLVGIKINGLEVKDVSQLENYITEHKIKIGVIAVPEKAAQEIANKMVRAGIQGIWNFAPVDLKCPQEIKIENEHLTEGLLRLSFKIDE
ncbi:AT-rich DNA-binding protein [Halobacteroides halobius DSM 5150]|uniref:Redox-sensing transcriptional repressor Rex n=1 Tax=Halobacteroides halobius (strain ATCC 35273 / DSM 5150 / MD-1) TaxID=748449 RepID=L0K446_HALHC|nr:redox-sensing transcriptional repressor Rex [Halobacteroides halobius]AGB40062.1 AT-rich DNA-binding protein [Halobacteroides halobius DSM 5150]